MIKVYCDGCGDEVPITRVQSTHLWEALREAYKTGGQHGLSVRCTACEGGMSELLKPPPIEVGVQGTPGKYRLTDQNGRLIGNTTEVNIRIKAPGDCEVTARFINVPLNIRIGGDKVTWIQETDPKKTLPVRSVILLND